MSLRKYRERLKIIDHHLQIKAPGNIRSLAYKLELSEAGAYKFLEEMKGEGFPIAYSKKENRYYYTKPRKMVGYIFVEDTDKNDEEKSSRSG